MSCIGRIAVALALASAVSLVPGCDGGGARVSPEAGAELVRGNTMSELGELLRLHAATGGKPPARSADLAGSEMAFPVGFQKVKTGEVVLLYGAPLEEKAGDKILAYEKQVPESGGYVLMQDGTTIQKLTPEQFQSMAKAPGKPEAKRK